MKNKSKKKFLILILFVILGLNLINVKADSGFDFSYSGGSSSSSSGGSSWSSSWSSSSSSGYSSDLGKSLTKEQSYVFILMYSVIFLLLVIAVVKTIFYDKKEEKQNSDISDKIINQIIPNFDKNNFKDLAYSIYKDVQVAWMDFDYDKLRSLLSDEMFNMYKSQLETLKLKEQQNIMKDFKLYGVYIRGIRKENENIIVDVKLCVSCLDYIIDSNKKVIKGDDWLRPYYEYELTYLKSKTVKENNICPNCGAKLNNQQSNKCEHCNSIVISNKYDWILISKRMIN